MFEAQEIRNGEVKAREVAVPEERIIPVYLNGRELVTLTASPGDLEDLALGFLVSEGLVASQKLLKRVSIDENGCVWLETRNKISHCGARRKILTSGCGKGVVFEVGEGFKKISRRAKISFEDLGKLIQKGIKDSEKAKTSRGLHAAFLCNRREILSLKVDIGRHNAVDKVIGEAFRKDFLKKAVVLVTTGRASSELVFKTLRARIPILVSLSSPTDTAVELAENYDLTLLGYARLGRALIFTHGWRIVYSEKKVEEICSLSYNLSERM